MAFFGRMASKVIPTRRPGMVCPRAAGGQPGLYTFLLSTVHGSSADTGTTFHPRRTFDPLCATPGHREVAAHYNCLQIVRPRLRCTSSCQAPMLLRFHLCGGTFARSRYSFGSVRPRQTTRQPRLFGRDHLGVAFVCSRDTLGDIVSWPPLW